jgi:AcrR family transcriptional regulator
VRGAAPLPGYWNDPEATARSLTVDGFYRTGDIGTLDADGYLTIVDRLSDLVITGGENVYPAEVEAVLAGHPAVADVAVIGVPDERWGETVHAIVVLVPGNTARANGDARARVRRRRTGQLGARAAGRVQVPDRGHGRPRAAPQRDRQGAAGRAASAVLGRPRPAGLVTAPAPARPATATRPEKATRKGRQTDEAFREAARLVFARDGYLNAKISDIAAAAGRSVASFYNYYDTKADLLIALAEEFHAEASQLAALPYRAGLSGEEALREAVAGFWRTYAKRRGELIGIFQAAMVEGRFRDRWLELRGEAITRIATAVRKAQADGYCPGVDPVMTASALSAMLEHFCYIWLGQGGEKDVPFDDDLALDALCTIWVKAVYWRPDVG